MTATHSMIPASVRVRETPIDFDLRTVFASEATRSSRDRVIKYLHQIYMNYSQFTREELFEQNRPQEQFYLAMPTVEAHNGEIELCNGILGHTAGELSDQDVKVYLKRYLDTHIFLCDSSSKKPKCGDLQNWTRGELFYLTSNDGAIAETVNVIQAWLLYLIEKLNGRNEWSIVRL